MSKAQMPHPDLQYHDLLRNVVEVNQLSDNRTNTRTIKVFGRTMRYDLSNGMVPVITTKYLHLKSIIHELIWFITGDTNNKTLADAGVRIWNEWAIGVDETVQRSYTYHERVELYAVKHGISVDDALADLRTVDTLAIASNPDYGPRDASESVLRDDMIPETYMDRTAVEGDLGPLYGKQWRGFPAGRYFRSLTITELGTYIDNLAPDQKAILDTYREPEGGIDLRLAREILEDIGIDQINQAITLLKTDPNSRRIIVTAWNPQVVPSGDISPQENVKRGRAALAACHTMFQFCTAELSESERLALLPLDPDNAHRTGVLQLQHMAMRAGILSDENHTSSPSALLDALNIPKYRLNCEFVCRSQDLFLGTPFNVASYAIFTHMVAHVTNMVAGELVWVGVDVHLYTNHLDQVATQLEREPYPSPRIVLDPAITNLFDFRPEHIKILDYQSHPAIKATVAV